MIRNAQVIETNEIVLRDKSSGNLFASGSEAGALENAWMDNGKLVRATFMPQLHTSAATAKVWRIYDFRFTRDNAPEQQLLVFKDDGRIYRRTGGVELLVPIAVASGTITTNVTNYAGTAADQAATWTNPTNAQGAPNSSNATAATTAELGNTSLLRCTNYGFSTSVVLQGIRATITGSGSGDDVPHIYAQLVLNGAAIGTQYNSTFYGTTATFGSANDLWGTSLTPADVNGTTFGVEFYCINSPGANNYSIDAAGITLTYRDTTAAEDVLLQAKPRLAQLKNKLHITDGHVYYVYDGWNVHVAGLAQPTAAPSVALAGAGTLNGTYKAAVTWAHIRSNNGVDVRIHESSRSAISAAVSPVNQVFTVDISALSPPARATHWSAYVSDLANSDRLIRAATTAIGTTSITVSANPAANSPIAPVRNDPVQPTLILTGWKNRLAQRNETSPDQLWFTAFGEVDAYSNGSGDECLPGRASSSISDIVNSWTLPDGGSPLMAAVWHDGFLFAFNRVAGYLVQGEGALLDDVGLRDFFPLKRFMFGAASPFAVCSTPHGLVVLSPERKLWLWQGGEQSIEIGKDIQDRLDGLDDADLANLEIISWESGNQSWLLINLPDRIQVFDFKVRTDLSPLGIWFSLGSQGALAPVTSLGTYNPGVPLLLAGLNDGTVRQLATLCQPAHLGLSMVLGETYFGSTVQASPTAIARTGPIQANGNQWLIPLYVTYYQVGHTDSDSSGIVAANPAVLAYYDRVNPANPIGGITLTSSTVNDSNERRAWFKPSAAGSTGGVLAKQYQSELRWTTTTNNGAARPQLVNNTIEKLSVTQQIKKAGMQ